MTTVALSITSLAVSARIPILIGFALTAVFLDPLKLQLPFYLPTCPCNAKHFSNVVGIPVLTFAAAMLVALVAALPSTSVRFVVGGTLGLAGAMYVGLVSSVGAALDDPYLTWPYRAYALAYLVTATAIASAVVRRLSEGSRIDRVVPLSFAAVAVLAVGASLVHGQTAPTLAAVLGVVAGWVVPLRRPVFPRMPVTLLPAVVVVVAFAMRAAFGLQALARLGPGMPFAITSDDGDSYYLGAMAIWNDPNGLRAAFNNGWFPPGYTVLLAGLLGPRENFVLLVLAQAALGAAAAAALYLGARAMFPRPVALLATLLFVLDVDVIQSSATVTAEALLIPLLLFALSALTRYAQRGTWVWLAAAAICLGAAFITRNLTIALLAPAVIWLAAREVRRPLVLTRDLATIAVALLVFTLPTALVTVGYGGGPRLTNQSAALAFETEVNGVTIDNQALVARGIHLTNDPIGGVIRLLSDPVFSATFFARAIPNRLSTFFLAPSPGTFDPVTIINPAHYPSSFGQLAELVRTLLLAVAVVLLIVRRPWRGRPVVLVWVGFAAVYVGMFTLVFLPSHPFRYRVPVEPIVMLAEAAAGWYVVTWARTLPWRRDTSRAPAASGV